VFAHLARDMSQDDMPIIHLDAKTRTGECFDDLALKDDGFFFRQDLLIAYFSVEGGRGQPVGSSTAVV